MAGLRALFLGSINPATVAAMHGWLEAGNSIAAFWRGATATRGPVKRDRRLALIAPRWSVAALARRHGFPVRDVPCLGSWPDAARAAREAGADVLVSVYFPFAIPEDMLALFDGRAVNFHPAPLPLYRGPMPVYAMIRDRSVLSAGAMSVHVLTPGLDEGPVVAQERVAFPDDFDLLRYEFALARAAGRMARDALPRFFAGETPAVPQDETAATHVRLTRGDIALSSRLSADDVRWYCATFARREPLEIAGAGGAKAVGFRGIVGPKTGAPPRVGPFGVTFDAADARVRVKRKGPLSSYTRRLRRLVMLLREPAQC